MKQSTDWRAYCTEWGIPPTDELAAAGELLFRAEGARVTNRRLWPVRANGYMPDQNPMAATCRPKYRYRGVGAHPRHLLAHRQITLGRAPFPPPRPPQALDRRPQSRRPPGPSSHHLQRPAVFAGSRSRGGGKVTRSARFLMQT